MKERPILFNSTMVRAILEGRKTQTRRSVKDAFGAFWDHSGYKLALCDDGAFRFYDKSTGEDGYHAPVVRCPFGHAGEHLWVRETHSLREYDPDEIEEYGDVWYWADGNPSFGNWTRPKPSIHMPRWASRITLEITGVRVERLQDISEDDAKAEGCPSGHWAIPSASSSRHTAKDNFARLWMDLGGNWRGNPWAWCIEFKKL